MAKDKVIPSNLVLCNEKFKYDNVEQMVNDTGLQLDNVVELLGYYKAGDGAGHQRIIASEDDGSGVQLGSGLWANIVHNDIVHSNWFGVNKDGDASEIFKKMVAYNKPTIIDYGNYELSEHIFDVEGIVQEDRGTYTNKYLIKTDKLPNNKPHKEMIGIFNYKGIMTARGHQSIAYNKNTQEYILGFTNTSSEQSTLIFLDKNFNYKKKVNLDLGHCNGLTYNPRTNQLIAGGYLGSTDKANKIFVLDYDSLSIIKEVDIGYTLSGVGYDDKSDLYMAGGLKKYSLLDKDFNIIKTFTTNYGNNYTGLVSQDTEFFRGNYLTYLYNVPTIGKIHIFAYDLKGDLTQHYQFDSQDNGDEPEGIFVLDDNTLLVTEYQGTEIKFFKLDFNKISINATEVNENYTTTRYVDSSAEFEGDGSQEKPYKTIRYALLDNIQNKILNLKLKGDFDEAPSFRNKIELTMDKWGDEKPIISGGQVLFIGISHVVLTNIKIAPKTFVDRYLFAKGSNFYINQCEFSHSSVPTGYYRGIGLYRCNAIFFNSTFNNSTYICAIAEGSNARFENCSGTGNTNRFEVNGGIAYHINVDVGTTKDTIRVGTVYPEQVTVLSLNTPYHINLMEQEGGTTKEDYYSYLDEKYAYDAQVQAEEQAKYEAYNLALQNNPELTWEEFLMSYPTTIISLEEPVIPETVQAFMDKYLGVKATRQSKINYTSDQNTFQKW